MEYLIDLRFDDKSYRAIIHFVATFIVQNEKDAIEFKDELLAGFKRRGIIILNINCYRIDNNQILRNRAYEYCQFSKEQATASIEVEQFILSNPDQTKSLSNNLIEKFYNGENSTANIGKKYNIPVRVLDKETRNPISDELYYFTIEHLMPN
ncbi:MAG: hypothetical protein JXQ93_02075 [Flavobacteriaceae bacterium]